MDESIVAAAGSAGPLVVVEVSPGVDDVVDGMVGPSTVVGGASETGSLEHAVISVNTAISTTQRMADPRRWSETTSGDLRDSTVPYRLYDVHS
jgi:hypothetical protein